MSMDKIFSFLVEIPGIRLDKYVAEKCPELSRTHAQKLIADAYVKVNGQVAKSSLNLYEGDRVLITIPPPPPSPLTPEAIPLKIVYEDADLLVVDKPAGLIVHPSPGHPSHTLINAVIAHFPRLVEISDSLRPGIVHRLDRDTSGLVLIAKRSIAQMNLINQFKVRTVVKAYLTLVKGRLVPEDGIIEAPIGRDPRNRKRMAVVSGGKDARTRYHVVRYLGGCTLLEVRPETGRTHQIRVHLSAIGFPVMGDKVYGVKLSYLPRQFLHACRLGFNLPSTDEYVEFKSELPVDLAQALESIV
jgi:23S rRNA pseudouridine1911/1915/1917 synthase